jgi:hypothetical protein
MSTTVSTRTPGALSTARQQLDELDALLKRMLELPVNRLDETDESEEIDEPPPAPAVRDMEPTPASPPISYMVVETASPRPIPPASGFEPRQPLLAPRLVPVTPRPEPVAEQPVPIPAPEPVPAVAPAPEPEASTEAEQWVPLRSTWQPSAQTWQPLAESWRQAHGSLPLAATMPTPIPEPPADNTPPIEITLPLTPAPVHPVPPPARMAAPPVSPVETPAAPRLRLTAEDAPPSVPRLLLPLLWFNQGFDACLTPLGAPGRWLCGPSGRQLLGTIGLLSLAAATAILVAAGMGWSW